MKSFAELKANTRQSFDNLIQRQLEKETKNQKSVDTRFWTPTINADGNASAIIRFLPPSPNEDFSVVHYYDHYFEGPGGFYSEICPTSIKGKKCPLCDANSELWQEGSKKSKDLASLRKRRLHFVTNILVIRDKAKPENEGKVFLWKFGSKLWTKIETASKPQFEGEDPINPFNLWAPIGLSGEDKIEWIKKKGPPGANFRVNVTTAEFTNSQNKKIKYNNYDASRFDAMSTLADELKFSPEESDAKLAEIWNKQYSLVEFVDDKKIKSYDKLKEKLDRVLEAKTKEVKTAMDEIENDDPPFDIDEDKDLAAFKELLDAR